MEADILIVGGGTGGCAAAMAATAMGCRVILTEPSAWLGGQLTSQAVPPDEHPWIEECGCTARYRHFRQGVRDYYRRCYPMLPRAKRDATLNPGLSTVSPLSHEPRVALAVIEQMLAFARASGRLRVLMGYAPIAAESESDRIRSVTLCDAETGDSVTISAKFVLDATELGDVLALAGVEYISGAESREQTGEPHAVDGPAQPDNVQALTWCLPLAYDPAPGADHTTDAPAQYARWRQYNPALRPQWSGPLLSWQASNPITLKPRSYRLFDDPSGIEFSLWRYRRIVAADHYPAGEKPHEITIVNWPQNDYWCGNIIDKTPDQISECLEQAKQLSLSLVHWLQTEAPRLDGGVGYPGLYMVPELTGTVDGLAQTPYIRESRRIKAVRTVTENDVGAAARRGRGAEKFYDSVGIGYYRIDLHPSTGGDNYIDVESMPFQIPLGALLPIRVNNLLPACKNIGTTHISNGCYRVHPVEWNIGEAAGVVAAYCIAKKTIPRHVREDRHHLEALQATLRDQGFELTWPESVIEKVRREYAQSLQAVTESCG